MAFARSQTVSNDDGRNVLHYSVDIEYLFQRLKYFIPDLTISELEDILDNFSVDDVVMIGIIGEHDKKRLEK